MKVKPKEIMVVLPAAHLFQSEEEMASFASAINTIIHGKVKIKYEVLGQLGGQYVGLFYIQRNNESQQIHDEFMRMIDAEEMAKVVEYGDDLFNSEEREEKSETDEHTECLDCDTYIMLHHKGLQHCCCGEEWYDGKCDSQAEER